ncbi:MAG TPA: sensor domain-containing protein [Propionibacteriaceae bacterium]
MNLQLQAVTSLGTDRGETDGVERAVGLIRRTGRELGAIVGLFFVSLAAFIVCVILFSVGAGTVVIVAGLFVLLACLVAAGGFARANRALLAYAGHQLPAPIYPQPRPGARGRLRRLVHAQSWRDLLHVPISFILATVSFSLAVSWVAGGLGGVTFWLWSRFLPDDSRGLAWLLGFPGRFAESALNGVAGGLLLITAPALIHGLISLYAAIARGLLVDERSALRQQVSALTESRTAAGEAEAHTLRRLERDLHDGPQQRLVRLGMDISAARRRLADDPDKADQLLDEAFQQSQDALAEIRTLSRGIAPPILAEHGLKAAVTALVARGSIPTAVDVGPARLSDAALNAAYFVVAEALANLEKHSGAETASVEIGSLGRVVVISVTDDGRGGASLAKGHGLAGLADRLAGVDGSLVVASPTGGPTTVTATLPASA